MEDTLYLDSCVLFRPSVDTNSVKADSVVSVVQTRDEFYEKDDRVLGMSQGAATILIPTIASIIVFCLGVIIERRRERIKEERERNKYRSAVLKWIGLLCTPINIQIKQLKDFASKIADSTEFQPETLSFSKSMANKINDLSVEKIITAFVTKEKKESSDDSVQAYNIVSQIDFLSSCDEEIFKKYNDYSSRCIELIEKWNSSWNRFADLRNNSKASQSQDFVVWRNVILQYKNWRDQYGQNEHLDYGVISKELIMPLFQNLIQMKSEYPSSALATQFHDVIHSLYLILNEWNVIKSGYRVVFNDMANQIEKSYSVLVEAKEYFK